MVDVFVFILIGVIMILMFLIPSKKRIREHGIIHIPTMAKTGQYLLGALAIILCIGLLAFYFTQDGKWWNILNAGFLGPLGLMLLVNSYSTNKLVGEMAALEGDDGIIIADDEEEEIVAVAEVKAASPRTRPEPKAAPAPKKKYETITIQCPGCDKFLKIENRGEGTPITCPSCGLEGEL